MNNICTKKSKRDDLKTQKAHTTSAKMLESPKQ